MGCCTEPAFVHVAHVMQKLHFFQFFNFFLNLRKLPQKKDYMHSPQKKFQLLFVIYRLYATTKNYMTYSTKKLHELVIFLYTSYIFH